MAHLPAEREVSGISPFLVGRGEGGCEARGQGFQASVQTDLGGGLGLKLELKFVFRINPEGRIIEHTIVETRVNGQLTPGDVVTRLWKGTAIEGSSSPVQSVWDALNWARAMASSSS